MVANPSQFAAIQNGANADSLVSQLFAKPKIPQVVPQGPMSYANMSVAPVTTPAAQQPDAVAASSQVRGPSSPPSQLGQPNQTVAAGTNTPGYTYSGGILTSVGGKALAPITPQQAPPVLGSLGTTPVVKQTINADGSQSVTHAQPDSGTQPSSPAPQQQNTVATPPSYQGLIGNLAQNSQTGSPIAGQAAQGLLNSGQSNPLTSGQAYDNYQTAVNNLAKLKSGIAAQQGGIESEAIPLQFQQGREQALNRQYASQLDAAQQEVTQAQAALGYGIQEQQAQQSGLTSAGGLGNTAQGLLQSGLTSATGFESPSQTNVQVPYSNQYINGTTGQAIGGGGTGALPQSGQDFVTSLAQQVQNGQMTRDEAAGQLSSYGPAGLQALNTALGSGFNTNASNASAATTATGQVLQTQAVAANQALDTLSGLYQNLTGLTGTTGFQPANFLEQSIANLFGSDSVGKYTTTLQEARAKISGVLAASGGVTPTTADEMAKTYLPDGMTPSQLPAKIAAAKTLIQQSVDAFTNSGQQNQNANPTQPIGYY